MRSQRLLRSCINVLEKILRASTQMMISPSMIYFLLDVNLTISLLDGRERKQQLQLIQSDIPFDRAARFVFGRMGRGLKLMVLKVKMGRFLSHRERKTLCLLSLVGLSSFLVIEIHPCASKIMRRLGKYLRDIVFQVALCGRRLQVSMGRSRGGDGQEDHRFHEVPFEDCFVFRHRCDRSCGYLCMPLLKEVEELDRLLDEEEETDDESPEEEATTNRN